MLDNLIGYLNTLRAGDVLLFLITVCWAGLYIKKNVMDLKKKHEESVERELKTKNEATKLLADLTKANEEIITLRTDLDSHFAEVQEKIDQHIQKDNDNTEKLETTLSEFNKLAVDYIQKIEALEKRVEKMEKEIDLLFKSDQEYIRVFIMDGYTKYVKNQHSIDLVSLQNLESIYNKYLDETDGKDEFLAKLMKELRDLPTTKERKER